MKFIFIGLVGISLAINAHSDSVNHKKTGKNKILPALFMLPFQLPVIKRFSQAYKHSNLDTPRLLSDCNPDCPKVDIWKYAYKPPGSKRAIIDDNPVSTKKAYWKNDSEARIIAVTLFGKNKIYMNGLIDFIDSIKRLRKVNKIRRHNFAYGSFTIRVYIAQRNPMNRFLGPLEGTTDPVFIKKLIDRGVEIAFVDNHLNRVGLDATFWRFMIAAEDMPNGQRIRYLIRDVDWFLTALDVYILGDWLHKEHQFHRMNIAPLCISPLVASMWGGTHQGKGPFSDLRNHIEYYPYRLVYGDDEVFLKDIVWGKMKSTGSVLTHIIKKRTLLNKIIEPYKDSCEEPTAKFCASYTAENRCLDSFIPKAINFPIMALSNRKRLEAMQDDVFFLDKSDPEIQKAVSVLFNE